MRASSGAATAAFWPAVAAAAPSSTGAFGDNESGFGWIGEIFGPLLLVVIVVAALASAVLVLRWAGALPRSRRTAPLRSLEERFARGEIDAAELAEGKKALDG